MNSASSHVNTSEFVKKFKARHWVVQVYANIQEN